MRRKTYRLGLLWRLIIALILALCLVSISSNPVFALSASDYFLISYDVQFSKTEIDEGEVFSATVEAEATCVKSLPLTVGEARITGCIVAEHQVTGARVTLNSSYTVTISPFPSQAGETTQVSKAIPLQFPEGSESGTYSVTGELIEAEVYAIRWWSVTAYLPQFQALGSLTYTSADFVVSDLSITPAEVKIGEEVTISTLITSTGAVAHSYKVTLKIDNVVVATKEVTLEGGASEEVNFTTAKDVAGTYTVTVDGLSGTFVVGVPSPINWWLLGGIIAACIALVVVIYLTVIRQRA